MPDLPKMLEYQLTQDKFEKYIAASRSVTALIDKDPAYRQRMTAAPGNAPRTLDESVEYARKNLPEYTRAVEKNGISFREYTLLEGCLLISWLEFTKPRPKSKIHASPENLAFVAARKDLIAKILREKAAR